ncbi:MAG: flagellar type III secretion system pore protein FliP [Pusillimonas sp.]
MTTPTSHHQGLRAPSQSWHAPAKPAPQGCLAAQYRAPQRSCPARHLKHLLGVAALLIIVGLFGSQAFAQGLPAFTATPGPDGAQNYSLSLQTLLLLTMMSFLPAMLLMMTGFTRVIIVLGLLRNAMGTGASPPNSVLLGLALFLTFFAMSPVFDQVYQQAYLPLSTGELTFEPALAAAAEPMKAFMLSHTRETDLSLFANMAGIGELETPQDVPLRVLVPAFVTSELKTAFQIGFTIFIPFLIIDLVVASVLMALGMMMVPPVTISLPFKLMLFVLADGWHLLLGSLARSFAV